MLGVDHDNIILLFTTFPIIPMLGTHFCFNVILFYVGNKQCCIVLYYKVTQPGTNNTKTLIEDTLDLPHGIAVYPQKG